MLLFGLCKSSGSYKNFRLYILQVFGFQVMRVCSGAYGVGYLVSFFYKCLVFSDDCQLHNTYILGHYNSSFCQHEFVILCNCGAIFCMLFFSICIWMCNLVNNFLDFFSSMRDIGDAIVFFNLGFLMFVVHHHCYLVL